MLLVAAISLQPVGGSAKNPPANPEEKPVRTRTSPTPTTPPRPRTTTTPTEVAWWNLCGKPLVHNFVLFRTRDFAFCLFSESEQWLLLMRSAPMVASSHNRNPQLTKSHIFMGTPRIQYTPSTGLQGSSKSLLRKDGPAPSPSTPQPPLYGNIVKNGTIGNSTALGNRGNGNL